MVVPSALTTVVLVDFGGRPTLLAVVAAADPCLADFWLPPPVRALEPAAQPLMVLAAKVDEDLSGLEEDDDDDPSRSKELLLWTAKSEARFISSRRPIGEWAP